MVEQSSQSRGRQRSNARGDGRGDKATARRRRQARSRRDLASTAATSQAGARPNNVVNFPAPTAASVPAPSAPLGGFVFFLVWLLRLSILGAGLGAIIGTVLAIARPQVHSLLETPTIAPVEAVPVAAPPPALQPTRELTRLHEQFTTLAAAHPQLTPRAYVIDLDTGEYLDLGGSEPFSAASTITVPVLVALFQALEAGTIAPDERPPGSESAMLELAEEIIVASDNTAANMLVDRLGGAAALNTKFREWGLERTVLRGPLPDRSGTNTTSPQDLAKLMAMVEKGYLVEPQSRDRILAIMQRTQTRTPLRQGLGEGATIAGKTGDNSSMVGGVGVIELPSGKRYLAAVSIERPHNDPNARALIRAYSRAAYRYFASVPPRTGEFAAPAPLDVGAAPPP